jgi:hypothetical protein
MRRNRWKILAGLLAVACSSALGQTRPSPKKATEWRFAVSGDSRNCGDVVMPAIAAGALAHGVSFYWHLGDFRKISEPDEDIQHEPEHRAKSLTKDEYEAIVWDDFLQHQIAPFGKLPVFLGIGNHDTAEPKGRAEYLAKFAGWLDAPPLRAQRLRDDPNNRQVRSYYHWVERGVDFISLDNATKDQFDAGQMRWFDAVLARDENNPAIRTIVVGMHRALPESISKGHSMNESPEGTESGRTVYTKLLQARDQAHKRVYVVASHSHYFMDGTFNTDYWRTHGGVLPGWIVGTAGAVRYALPASAKDARAAQTHVYGYLLGTVSPGGVIRFEFQLIREPDVPAAVVHDYQPDFVHWCFAENPQRH